MRSETLLSIFFSLILITSKAQIKILTKQQVKEDIASLRKILNKNLSYVYLNGYGFNKDFENYQQNLKDSTQLEDFGFFLTEMIGKIGDRHSSVKGYEPSDTLFLPITYANVKNNVVILNRNRNKEYEFTNGILLEFQSERLIKHNLFEPNSETVMAVITYEFQEKDGATLVTGKEELTQPLDKTTFDDASSGWKSALNLVKQIAETL